MSIVKKIKFFEIFVRVIVSINIMIHNWCIALLFVGQLFYMLGI